MARRALGAALLGLGSGISDMGRGYISLRQSEDDRAFQREQARLANERADRAEQIQNFLTNVELEKQGYVFPSIALALRTPPAAPDITPPTPRLGMAAGTETQDTGMVPPPRLDIGRDGPELPSLFGAEQLDLPKPPRVVWTAGGFNPERSLAARTQEMEVGRAREAAGRAGVDADAAEAVLRGVPPSLFETPEPPRLQAIDGGRAIFDPTTGTVRPSGYTPPEAPEATTRAAPSFPQALQALQERFRDPNQAPLNVQAGLEAPRYLVPYETMIDMALRMASGEDVDLSLPPTPRTPVPRDPSAPRGSEANPIDLPPIRATPPVSTSGPFVDVGRMTPPPPRLDIGAPSSAANDEIAQARQMIAGRPPETARNALKAAGFTDAEIRTILGE